MSGFRSFGAPFGKMLVVITSHDGASGSTGNPRRLRSIRTRCTCCHPDHADEAGLDRTHTHVRSSTSRTIRSASRRRGARESGLSRMRIRARSSSNRNVCILSPSQFSFRRVVYQTDSPRAIPPPISFPNWKLATLELATLPHWQHSRPRPVGRGLRPRRHPVFTSPMASPQEAICPTRRISDRT